MTAVIVAGILVVPGCLSGQRLSEDAASGVSLPAALLWKSPFPRLVVQIDYVEGRAPSADALSALRETLVNLTGKEDVRLLEPRIIPNLTASTAHVWTEATLLRLHERTDLVGLPVGAFGRNQTAYLYVLYPDGHFTGAHEVIGVEIANVIAVFKDGIADPLPVDRDPTIVVQERHFLLHELGHAFGLVNCGLPMQTPHEDSQSRCHSADYNSSVMCATCVDHIEAALATAGVPQLLWWQWVPREYDANDLADIAAFRATEPVSP
ncbi:MAG: hypothetical protein ACYDCK_09590 [Thermoplasmatota archaeon]